MACGGLCFCGCKRLLNMENVVLWIKKTGVSAGDSELNGGEWIEDLC